MVWCLRYSPWTSNRAGRLPGVQPGTPQGRESKLENSGHKLSTSVVYLSLSSRGGGEDLLVGLGE